MVCPLATRTTGAPRPLSPRSFTSFSQASEENGQSRIYLGIHWSFDKTEGIAQGNAIADWVFQNYLLPAPAPLTVAGGNSGHGPMAQTQKPSSFFVDASTVSALQAGPARSSSQSGPLVVPAQTGGPSRSTSQAQLASKGKVGSAGLSLGTEAKSKVSALDAVLGSSHFLDALGKPFATP